MAKRQPEEMKDIEECAIEIKAILRKYNCRICTDDYHSAWLYDRDTGETGDLPKEG